MTLRESAEHVIDGMDLSDLESDQKAKTRGESKRKGLNPLLLVAPVGGQMFDAYSTQGALRRGGAHEGNPAMAPLVDNPAALYGTKGAIGISTAILAQILAKTGHRTLGKIVAGVGTAAPVAAGISNMTKARP